MSTAIDTTEVARRMFRLAAGLGGVQSKIEAQGAVDAESSLNEDQLDELLGEKSALVEATGKFFEEKSQLAKMVSKTDGVAREFLDVQMREINEVFTDLVEKHIEPLVNRGLNRELDKVDENVATLMEEVELCVSGQRQTAFPDLLRAAEELKGRVTEIKSVPQKLFGKELNPRIEARWAQLEETLTKGIEAQKRKFEFEQRSQAVMEILEDLSQVIEDGSAIDPDDIPDWNARIARTFPKKDVDALDGEIYKLSTATGKGGAHWGTRHRYDDLPCLKQAFVNVVSRKFLAFLDSDDSAIKGDKVAQDAIFTAVHQKAGSPEASDAILWAKQHVALHLDTAYDKMGEILAQRELAAQKKGEEVIELQGLKGLLSLSMSEAGKRSILPSRFAQLPEALKTELYAGVWDLTTEDRKEEEQWGAKHYANNLVVLQLAIDRAIAARGGTVSTATLI